MNLIRKLKLSEIVDIKFTLKERKILKFLESKFSNLVEYIHVNIYSEKSFYYMNNNKFIFRLDSSENKKIYFIRGLGLWSILQNKFDLNDKIISELLQEYLQYKGFEISEPARQHWISKPTSIQKQYRAFLKNENNK